MIRVRLKPGRSPEDLSPRVVSRLGQLQEAKAQGAGFLVIPVENTLEATLWTLACFHSGLVAVPVPAALPASELAARLAQLPQGEFIFPHQLTGKSSGQPQLKALEEVWAVIFTSGSTGAPKGVALTGISLKAAAQQHARHSSFGSACWLLDLPLFHVGGFSVLTRAFFLQTEVALGGLKFEAEGTADWIRSGSVSAISLVPTSLGRLLREGPLPFSNLSMILLGGAPAQDALLKVAAELGAPVRQTYGMTETASQIATEKGPASGMIALPDTEIRLSQEGEILVRTPALAVGIFEKGFLRPLPLENGFFSTGDLGELSGDRLVIKGRKSDVIISGGKKIYPAEVESALSQNPQILEAAVFGRPDEEWGEEVCAAYVCAEGVKLNTEEERQRLKLCLESHKVPKRWIEVGQIPRSAAGKILRSHLAGLKPNRS